MSLRDRNFLRLYVLNYMKGLTMNCNKVEELLPAYLDGDLKDKVAGQVHDHLKSCLRCQEDVRLLNASWDVLETLETIMPSPDFRTRVWQSIEKEKDRHWVWFPWRQWAPAMAGIFIALATGVSLGVFHYQRRIPVTPSPTLVAVATFASPYSRGSIEHIIAGVRSQGVKGTNE